MREANVRTILFIKILRVSVFTFEHNIYKFWIFILDEFIYILKQQITLTTYFQVLFIVIYYQLNYMYATNPTCHLYHILLICVYKVLKLIFNNTLITCCFVKFCIYMS